MAAQQPHGYFRARTAASTLVFAVVLVTACTANAGLPTPTPSGTPTAAIVGTVTVVLASTPVPELTPPPPPPATLDVNTATVNELRALFTRNAILNGAQYANAIEANRPFRADDKDWSQLREALAQEKAPSATIDKIVSLLTR